MPEFLGLSKRGKDVVPDLLPCTLPSSRMRRTHAVYASLRLIPSYLHTRKFSRRSDRLLPAARSTRLRLLLSPPPPTPPVPHSASTIKHPNLSRLPPHSFTQGHLAKYPSAVHSGRAQALGVFYPSSPFGITPSRKISPQKSPTNIPRNIGMFRNESELQPNVSRNLRMQWERSVRPCRTFRPA